MFGRKSETSTFHRFAKSGVAVCIIASALSAPARAAVKVAVIDSGLSQPVTIGQLWCAFLQNNGYDCTLYPKTGPTEPLDQFDVVVDMSEEWTDPDGTLAQHLRKRRGVITWGRAPGALGLFSNPWIGANDIVNSCDDLVTLVRDPILGSIPPGTVVAFCGDGPCWNLLDTTGHPDAKVLARFPSYCSGGIGILRNTWEGGQSVYLFEQINPTWVLGEEIILSTLRTLSRPIPAASTWGLLLAALGMLICGALIVRRRHLFGRPFMSYVTKQEGTEGTLRQLVRVLLTAAVVLCALGAPARAAGKVAVIANTDGPATGWCVFLSNNGYDCTSFPASGPTEPLDPFQVIIDLSDVWTDPTGTLADQMRARKGVITWGPAPFALGIDANPIVQAWIGARDGALVDWALITTATDPILGPIPPGTEIANCGASICTALVDELPTAKVLARWSRWKGSIGILRNTWEGGQSVYFPTGFSPGSSPLQRETILRTVEILCRPIPAVSVWGLLAAFLMIAVASSIILQRRGSHPRDPNRAEKAGTWATRMLFLMTLCACLDSSHQADGQPAQDNVVIVRANSQSNELLLNDPNGQPFHVTDRSVINARMVEVSGSAILLGLWDEVNPQGVGSPFYAISLDGHAVNYVTTTSYTLHLRYASFDPAVAVPAIDSSLIADPNADVYLVQFVTQPLPEFSVALQNAGALVKGFVGSNACIAQMGVDARKAVTALPFVRWVGPFHPVYKLEEEILTDLTTVASTVPPKLYSIMLWDRGEAEQQVVAERITELGGCVRRLVPEQHHLNATLTLAQVREVANLPGVAFIDVPGEIEPAVNVARNISGANHLDFPGGYTGVGVRGEVMDSGLEIDPFHVDFQSRPPILHGPNDPSLAYHGTPVFGLIFGDGYGSSTARGILPGAQGIFAIWDPFNDPVPPGQDCTAFQRGGRYAHVAQLLDPLYGYNAVFQNNSWGHNEKTTYTVISAEMDDIAFSLDLTLCQAQGNKGTLTPPQLSLPEAWSKNVLSVGGMIHMGTLTHADDSWCDGDNGCNRVFCASIGPAADGRVKPDLIHFFDCRIRTTIQSYDDCPNPCYTSTFSGTSAATPITCGYAGLVYQMWHESVFNVWNGTTSVPTGTPNGTVFSDRPHATTVKAMLINTAYRYPLFSEPVLADRDFTRENMGWGIVDVAALYEQRSNMFIVNETDLLTLFATRSYTYTVPTGSPALRVTMVYADPPATPCTSVHLVNDLSLKVVSPSGSVYWGNWGLIQYGLQYADYYHELPFVGNWSLLDTEPSNAKKDHTNNVENVFIKNPTPGTWTITVSADSIVQDGHVETPGLDADYALVVSSGDRPRGRCCRCSPTMMCTWTTHDDCSALVGQWTSEDTCANKCNSLLCPQ